MEDWGAAYGPAYLVPADDAGSQSATLLEDGAALVAHDGVAPSSAALRLAFVDGVRRGEASLWQEDSASGRSARGVVGSHACGAVLVSDAGIEFGEVRIRRLVIWGSGLSGSLPRVAGGWAWDVASIADQHPDAPLKELQKRMRQEEGRLAEAACAEGHLTVVDGPLNYVRSRDLPVVGFVKTHYRALLDPINHRRIPALGPGQRTSLFSLGEDRYSCYLRLTPVGPTSSPWGGIVRIEVPQSAGLQEGVRVAGLVAGTVPRFAGVAHRDPRAPQNLQPIGALERHLRHRLGSAGLAARAVREAVSRLVVAS